VEYLVSVGADSFVGPLYTLWTSFKNIFPGLIAAIIILIIGYIIAMLLGHAVRIILEKVGVDQKVRKAKLVKNVGHIHLPKIFGEITKWYVFIIFLHVAVDILELGALTIVLGKFVSWLPNVIAAVLIFIFGLALAHIIEMKIAEHSSMKGVLLASHIVKIAVLIIVAVVALRQMGIEVGLLENLVLLVVGSLSVGIALALGIGVGLGMKKDAEKFIDNFKKRHF